MCIFARIRALTLVTITSTIAVTVIVPATIVGTFLDIHRTAVTSQINDININIAMTGFDVALESLQPYLDFLQLLL